MISLPRTKIDLLEPHLSATFRWKQYGESQTQHRRDQRAVCFAPRVAGRSYAYRPEPFRFANRALVTSGHPYSAAIAAGFRLWLGSGVALRLRSAKRFSPPPLHLPRSPTADRSPFYRRAGRDTRRDSAYC
jgi:hypothetical protein